jgi:Tetratricopeptide repeat
MMCVARCYSELRARKDFLWPAATCIATILVISSLVSLRDKPTETKTASKVAKLERDLRQEPASPYRWCDLGQAFLGEGQKENARYCFEQAKRLAPNLPGIWMRASDFHFRMGDIDQALQSTAKVLTIAPDFDEPIFEYYDRYVPAVSDVLPHLDVNRRAGQAYFRHILKAERTADASSAWKWLRQRSFADDHLAAEYLDLLLKHRMFANAVETWASYEREHRGDYPYPNLLFNGGFENEPTGAALDWTISDVSGAITSRDRSSVKSGAYSLHIVFHGLGNVDYGHVVQTVYVRPGEYQLQAFARTAALTTEEGIRLHIFDSESSSRLDVYTEQLTGTNDWTRIEKRFRVPAGTDLIKVQVCRRRSSKFDNRIRGEAWIDAMSLLAVSPLSHDQ